MKVIPKIPKMRHIKNKQKHEADEYILNQAVPNSQKEKDQ